MVIGSQAVQAEPLLPHCDTEVGETHIDPAQQPAQPAPQASPQTPETQVPVAHISHAEPPVPHALPVVPGLQVLPVQQPAHDALLHTQLPPLHT